jgi:uncharacterized protein YxjI
VTTPEAGIPAGERASIAFPLSLRFRVLALGQKIEVRDANGALLYFVKQKAFKLREAVTIFADESQQTALYTIEADRVLDFSARYHMSDVRHGVALGVVQRQGMRSIWKAHYDIQREGQHVMSIREENPWVKLVDGILGDIPLIGLLSGYILHPSYRVTKASDENAVLLRVKKQPAFWEGRFTLERLQNPEPDHEVLGVLSVVMFLLLERSRG